MTGTESTTIDESGIRKAAREKLNRAIVDEIGERRSNDTERVVRWHRNWHEGPDRKVRTEHGTHIAMINEAGEWRLFWGFYAGEGPGAEADARSNFDARSRRGDQGHVDERLDAARKALAEAMTALDHARQMATDRQQQRRITDLEQAADRLLDKIDAERSGEAALQDLGDGLTGSRAQMLAEKMTEARKTVAQSAAIHPDWTITDHQDYLRTEVYVEASREQISGWLEAAR